LGASKDKNQYGAGHKNKRYHAGQDKTKDKKLATFCSNIAGKRLKITYQRSKIALALQKDIVNRVEAV
jgi:hypothetical protein